MLGLSPLWCQNTPYILAVISRSAGGQAEGLATLLAKLAGETKTEAVTQALKERLERVPRTGSNRGLAGDRDEIALRGAVREFEVTTESR